MPEWLERMAGSPGGRLLFLAVYVLVSLAFTSLLAWLLGRPWSLADHLLPALGMGAMIAVLLPRLVDRDRR